MKNLSPRLLAAVALVSVGAFSAPAAFAQGTYTSAAAASNCTTAGTASADSVTCAKASSINPTLTAWGFMGTLSSTASTGWQVGRMADHDSLGFGAYTGNNESTTGAHHAFDDLTSSCGTGSGASGGSNPLNSTANGGCGGKIEGMLLNFGSNKVNLTNLGIGYNSVNADASVWAYTGNNFNMATQTAAGSTSTTGTTAAAMAGWTLVSNHDFGSGTGTQNTSGSIYSSYFMITTYFGAATSTLTAANNSFKLNSFSVGVCTGAGQSLSGGSSGGTGAANNGNGATCGGTGVPEPGSLALVGLALVGGAAARRRALRA